MDKTKILVVEDSSLIAAGLKMNLEKFGYKVIGPASSGEEAIQLVKDTNPDLVLMDIILAGEIDGIHAVTEIQKENPVPVLYLTGHTDDQKVKAAKATNPLGYIIKPYKENQLRIILEMALNKVKVDKELTEYRQGLEQMVKQRTAELQKTNHRLEQEIVEHKKTAEQLIIAKEKAEESERLKTAFLTNMSHEIRTPMNSIIGFTSLIGEPDISQDEREEYMTLINKSGEGLLQLIDNIIDIARFESGGLYFEKRECNLNDILSEIYTTADAWEMRQEKYNIDFFLRNTVEKSNLVIVTNKKRIIQVLLNLLENAFKFTETGMVEIGCQLTDSNKIEFYVKDTGIGIPDDKHELVFEKFWKIEDKKDKLYGGTGLGLSISKFVIGKLGGTLEVKSNLGEGSIFSFSISL